MRKHFRALSMGNGETSEKEVQELIARLEKAFNKHSGLQQGQGSLSKQVLEEGKEIIEDTVIDIATALGVRKGEFEL